MDCIPRWLTCPDSLGSLLGVVPVLFGPLQTLLALLPAILLALGSLLLAAVRPAGFKKLVRFLWNQKLFSACLLGGGACLIAGFPFRFLPASGQSPGGGDASAVSDWPAFRGGMGRLGRGPSREDSTADDPTVPRPIWNNVDDKTIYASPAVCGDRIIVSAVSELSPFSPAGRGAIVCLDAATGRALWRYAPRDFRATFSSPVVHDGLIVCGEGLHLVRDARITCLDLEGRLRWQFRTQSHVESTPAIALGNVYVGAGDDGFYCLALVPGSTADPVGGNVDSSIAGPQVLWHLAGKDFPDCESSPLVAGVVVYFGLGEGGRALCAVDANTGRLLWKLDTPYPVFAPPTFFDGRLYIGMGNGNYVQSAADLLEGKLAELQAAGAKEDALEEARRQFAPAGEVWCIDPATRQVVWKFSTSDTVLGAIACEGTGLFFGSRDGSVYSLSAAGQLLHRHNLREALVTSPAIGRRHLYLVTTEGRLYCLRRDTLEPQWDTRLGVGMNFVGSPVVSHGHVYVGTESNGLRCVGEPGEPPVPQWSQGERGGAGEASALGEQGSLAWQYPSTAENAFHVTAPLMPLAGFIYAAVHTAEGPRLLKLDASAGSSDDKRVVWAKALRHAVHVPPIGRGSSVFVVEEADEASQRNSMLRCIDAETGQETWSHELGLSAMSPLIERSTLVAWSQAASLAGIEPATGRVRWRLPLDARGVGSPVVCQGILLAATESSLHAIDLEAGVPLWQVPIDESAVKGLLVVGNDVLLAGAKGLARCRVSDGQLVWVAPIGICLTPSTTNQTVAAAVVRGVEPAANELVVVDLNTGKELRRSPATAAPCPYADEARVYYAAPAASTAADANVTAASIFTALDLRSGAADNWCELPAEWKPTQPLLVVQDHVYAVINDTLIIGLTSIQP